MSGEPAPDTEFTYLPKGGKPRASAKGTTPASGAKKITTKPPKPITYDDTTGEDDITGAEDTTAGAIDIVDLEGINWADVLDETIETSEAEIHKEAKIRKLKEEITSEINNAYIASKYEKQLNNLKITTSEGETKHIRDLTPEEKITNASAIEGAQEQVKSKFKERVYQIIWDAKRIPDQDPKSDDNTNINIFIKKSLNNKFGHSISKRNTQNGVRYADIAAHSPTYEGIDNVVHEGGASRAPAGRSSSPKAMFKKTSSSDEPSECIYSEFIPRGYICKGTEYTGVCTCKERKIVINTHTCPKFGKACTYLSDEHRRWCNHKIE
jgi:hypothetical protein